MMFKSMQTMAVVAKCWQVAGDGLTGDTVEPLSEMACTVSLLLVLDHLMVTSTHADTVTHEKSHW